jgi:hypothetical protein
MAPKKSYRQQLKQEMGELIDRLDMSELQKRFMKSRWLDQVLWLEGKAEKSQKWYFRLRLMTIIGGVVIPALVSLNINDNRTRAYLGWATFGLSQLVAISAAVDEFFHYGDRWNQYRKTAEELKTEGWQFFQLSGPYKTAASHAQAYTVFANRIEQTIQQDVQAYSALLREKMQKQEEQEEQQKFESLVNPPSGVISPATSTPPTATDSTESVPSTPSRSWEAPASRSRGTQPSGGSRFSPPGAPVETEGEDAPEARRLSPPGAPISPRTRGDNADANEFSPPGAPITPDRGNRDR